MYSQQHGGKHSHAPQQGDRLSDLFEQMKNEVHTLESECSVAKQQRDEYERKRKFFLKKINF